MVACSACAGVSKGSDSDLPQIEVARVKPVDGIPPDPRLSDDQIDLMKGVSLSSAQGVGGSWAIPMRPSTPFDERYGHW